MHDSIMEFMVLLLLLLYDATCKVAQCQLRRDLIGHLTELD